MMSQHTRTNAARRISRRAFTLIEMLTVIGILAILIAIIIPAINGARNAARKTDTRTQMVSVERASESFQIDNRRLPGYFSVKQMGQQINATDRCLTQMENILLDLAGGVSPSANARVTDPMTGEVLVGAVGPGSGAPNTPGAEQVWVDYRVMGSSTQNASGAIGKSYIVMDKKRFVHQNAPNGRAGNPSDHIDFPTLVDSFGQPILAWLAEEAPSAGVFAHIDSTLAGANGARFYQAQNAGFLNSSSLGKAKQDQRYLQSGSVISGDNSIVNVQKSMEALLGNASQPDPAAPAGTPRPLAARAPLVLHSAGLDGIYVGKLDKGGRSGAVLYQPNADPFGGALFDDIIVTGGN